MTSLLVRAMEVTTPLVFGARLIGARIVAQLDWSVMFWNLSELDRQRVLAALASTGAKFAVSEEPPHPAQSPGWVQVGSSSYYIYPLSGFGPKKE